jgi:putative modified peptide
MAGTPFAPELVDKLLDKLSSDDKFRAVFEQDPESALVELGAPKQFNFGPCLRPKKLASKDEIKRTRDLVRNKLLGIGNHEVHCLEAV